MAVIPSLDPKDTILAHMSKDEIKDLSRAQGGFEYNEYLDIPQFYRLGQIIRIPKVRDAIKTSFEMYKQAPSEGKKDIREGVDNLADKYLGKELPMPLDTSKGSPEVKQLSKNGVGGDTQIVALSKDVYDFFAETLGKVDKNPKDGLPQFETGSTLLSIIGGVIGTFIAPGIGTAIGAGLGNLGGSYVDDLIDPKNPDANKSFLERLPGALMAGGLGYLGGQAASGFGSGGMSGAWDALKTTGTDMLPYLIGGAHIAGLTDEEYRKRQNAAHHQSQMNDYNQNRDRAMQEYANRFSTMRDFKTGKLLRPKYAEGGAVRKIKDTMKSGYLDGNEGGQDDGLHTTVPNGSYIIDATSVSDLGDGNSKAGAKKIDQFIKSMRHIPVPKDVNKTPKVDVALSAGEYRIYPEDVARFGNGLLEEGHRALDNFIKLLRLDKQHSHESIPGKARDIHEYFKGGRV